MKLKVKLISIQGELPPDFDVDGEGTVEAADGATLADVLAAMGLPEDEDYVTLVNDDPVAANARPKRILESTDRLTIFPPIKGG